jgi:hypothetical protein
MVDKKSAWVAYPGYDGLEIELVNLSREKLVELRNECMHMTFDRKSRVPLEKLDEKKFVKEFTRATIKNWKGFKLKYLEDMILVDLGDTDPDTEMEYSQENAELLVSNSSDFDNWLNDAVFDLSNFRTRAAR